MEKHFVRKVKINKLRHLKDVEIKIDEFMRRPLIITGKSGTGKTTILEGMKDLLQYFETGHIDQMISDFDIDIDVADSEEVNVLYKQGNFILAYYEAGRTTDFEIPNGVEQIILKDAYSVYDKPGRLFIKYLVDLKTQQAFALNEGDMETADNVKSWFRRLETILKIMFDDESTKLKFYYRSYNFKIIQDNREPCGLNELSSGYRAILDIITDLMLRMDKNRACEEADYDFDTEGIVLIDELDLHLHAEAQRDILPFLRAIFPNIQFIITTHSEYVINSVKDAVVVNLDKTNKEKDPYELYYGDDDFNGDAVDIESRKEDILNGKIDFKNVDNFVVRNSEEELQYFNNKNSLDDIREVEDDDRYSELQQKIEEARKIFMRDAEEKKAREEKIMNEEHHAATQRAESNNVQNNTEEISEREKIRRARISNVFKKYEEHKM